MRDKKAAWKKYQNSKIEQDRQEYINKRNNSRDTLREAKQKSWEEFGQDVENNFRNNKKNFWNTVKGLRRGERKQIRNIKDKEGKLQTDEDKILRTWKKHYENKFKQIENNNNQGQAPNVQLEQVIEEEATISQEEVQIAIKATKTGKAEGYDQIAPEFIKYGGEEVVKRLTHIFQQAWEEGIIPGDWEQNLIIPIHKKGSSVECDNYRAICLAPVVLKIYTKILEKRIRKIVEPNMQDEQAAFRSNRQTQDHIYTIRTAIDKMLQHQRDVYIAFLDLTAAFDNINREQVWKVLDDKKIPNKLKRATESVYEKVYGRVRINGRISEQFRMDKGLKQGDSLSPLLFILLMDKVARECNNKCRQYRTKLGHWNMAPIYIQTTIFADDIAILADTPEKLKNILRVWEEKLKEKDMTVNPNKSKILHVTKNIQQSNISITMNGVELETVDEYKYLGTIITRNGKINREIKHRIQQASNVYYQLNRTIINKTEISTKTKLQIYKAVYQPTLLYGAESWPMTTKIEQQVQAAEMKYLRRIANKTRRDMERNTKIREDLGVRPIRQDIEQKHLLWYGHLKRMERSRLPRKCLEARMEGSRARGRPRRSWIEDIEAAGRERNKTLAEMDRLATNRKSWRQFVKKDPTP